MNKEFEDRGRFENRMENRKPRREDTCDRVENVGGFGKNKRFAAMAEEKKKYSSKKSLHEGENKGSFRRNGETGFRNNTKRTTDGFKSPRETALKALQDVVRGDAYASQALDRQLGSSKLKPEDRRLAASIFYFAVENRLYIEYALKQFIENKPDPVVMDILHIAAAQLLFMNKIPDHAAVNEAVKQTRAYHRDGFAGMVNGVLRNLIGARDAGTIQIPDKNADLESYISVRYSIAPAIVKRLVAAYGLEMTENIAAYAPAERTQTIRPNGMRMSNSAFEKYLDAQNLKWSRGHVKDSYIVSEAGNLSMLEGYRKGDFSIQGESSMLAAQAVQAKPGMQVLDACAAPGGKTCLIAESMNGSGRVFAWDVHEHRVELIRAAARRLKLENVRTTVRDARKPFDSIELTMDAVLVDAPCSGLGVIADKPDIKYRQNEESLSALPQLQTDILEACAKAVKVGGLLVYSTCTILPEENEEQIQKFTKAHPEFEMDVETDWLPENLKPLCKDGMMQIIPSRDRLEGFFIARMRRKGVR